MTGLLPYLTQQEKDEIDRILIDLGTPFSLWLPQVTPAWTWTWAYQRAIQQHLAKVTTGEIDRLMLFLPPRHGKSEMVTIRYPVWRLERDPGMRIIIGAYNQTLVNKFSRKARKIARHRLELSKERTAADDWETAEDGGVRAVGVGGGVTGMGGQLIVIDDPVKNREEANSQVYRDKVWDWYTDDLYTRLEPSGAIILIMTRWHEDDLAGRILASEEANQWTLVSLPALAEKDDPLERAIGEALCPARYDEAALARIQGVLGNSFWALYQQRPQPPEGSFFKRAWFEILPAPPPRFETLCRYWDKAGTDGDGDYTAGVLMGRFHGTYYVLDVVRGQWASGDREKIIAQTAQLDRDKWGAVRIWLEQEPGSSGKDSAYASVKNLAGFAAKAETVTGDKATRAEPYQAQAMISNVKLLRGSWIPAYLNELCAFPTGKNDDQVDGSSGAFVKISRSGGSMADVVGQPTEKSRWDLQGRGVSRWGA